MCVKVDFQRIIFKKVDTFALAKKKVSNNLVFLQVNFS